MTGVQTCALPISIMNFVGNLGYVAVAIVGSIFAANGIITIGDIQAFIQYVRNFTQPIQQLPIGIGCM